MPVGFGVAAYHPEGYRMATQVAGERKAAGVSIFSTGGNIGIALGPPVITALVTTVGLAGSLGLLVPGLLVAVLLLPVLTAPSLPLPSAAPPANPAPRATVQAESLLLLLVPPRARIPFGVTPDPPLY